MRMKAEERVTPDIVSYNAAIAAWGRSSHVEAEARSRALLQQVHLPAPHKHTLIHLTYTHTPLILVTHTHTHTSHTPHRNLSHTSLSHLLMYITHT